MGNADASVGASNATQGEPDSILLFQTTSWLHGHDTANHALPQDSMRTAKARTPLTQAWNIPMMDPESAQLRLRLPRPNQ
jgi:hypothetical protein